MAGRGDAEVKKRRGEPSVKKGEAGNTLQKRKAPGMAERYIEKERDEREKKMKKGNEGIG